MDILQPIKRQEEEALKQTIIIVEDDVSNAEVIALLIEQDSSYQTACFRDGDELFAKLESIKALNPVLFLLDYHLPIMTGLDLYERLHATNGLEKIPAIMVSAFSIPEKQKQRICQLGLLFTEKPYNIEEVLISIKQLIA